MSKNNPKVKKQGIANNVDSGQTGMIIVPVEDFESHPDETVELFNKLGFFPYSVDYRDEYEAFVMVGFSRNFRKIDHNAVPPFYNILRTENGDVHIMESKDVKLKRVDKEDFDRFNGFLEDFEMGTAH